MVRSRFFPVVITGLILALLVGGGAVAAKMITGKQIKNGTVSTKDVKNNNLKSKDLKNGGVSSKDIKNKTVDTEDLAGDSVTAGKIAPGAIEFPTSLWGPVIRNQTGGAESNVQAGPEGALGDGSLRLFVAALPDLAAFGNSFDFAGVPLEDFETVSYSTYRETAGPRPSLRFEIDPHLIADTDAGGLLEFTTLIHEAPSDLADWQSHDALAENAWYLTGTEGTDISCTQGSRCTFAEVLDRLDTHDDTDAEDPAISTGVYFALGSGIPAPTETAVDAFVFNNFRFNFEPMGVFVTPTP